MKRTTLTEFKAKALENPEVKAEYEALCRRRGRTRRTAQDTRFLFSIIVTTN